MAYPHHCLPVRAAKQRWAAKNPDFSPNTLPHLNIFQLLAPCRPLQQAGIISQMDLIDSFT